MPVYLKLGSLQGAVTAGPYKGWIEIDSYSWGFSVAVQTTAGAAGNRMSSGKVTPGDVHLVKRQDDTTTQFMLQSLEGKNTPEAQLAVTIQASDGAEAKYIEYVMKNVICTSFTTSGQSSGGEPMENIALNFSQVNFNQFLRDDTNAERAVRGGYDFTTAKKV
ncbi:MULTISPECIES: Hcp family type VI secretion system effector [Sphingosinicellaceae]|uniref:Hcp family type VI secretion system effector n=1 Tax=Sphingosinicellaceae TaxID=2820280 RepID=UPI001C1E203B|nr:MULTISPECIES: type VI secretion system tube protein Hcp [Polymorphobacter]QYE35377.1 type VI secretion system tube protein Hcp [Polymorphobacter sp. PAMC 29334]UAJ11316.1 type VI secretion system tube protein Hcp [Polymorphobacter megasporae]